MRKTDIIHRLEDPYNLDHLCNEGRHVKNHSRGRKVYFRGLIESSNICRKNCLYCGIRKDNQHINRYDLDDEEIIQSAQFAYENGYGSIVIQTGERRNSYFTERMSRLIRSIKQITHHELGITLSLGEQDAETYKEWYKAGAHRYLLRIETSNETLYKQLHPNDDTHNFAKRYACLEHLMRIGYQTGTGVMIGLPFQHTGHLAEDLLFLKNMNVDMVGMGPYLPAENTPLNDVDVPLYTPHQRYELSIKMIALLRMMMPDINIASTTALQSLHPHGREKAISAGANVIMPNVTPVAYRNHYKLYQDKACINDRPEQCNHCLHNRMDSIAHQIGYNEWGDSLHYFQRMSKQQIH